MMDSEDWLDKVLDELETAKKNGEQVNITSRLDEFLEQLGQLSISISENRYGII